MFLREIFELTCSDKVSTARDEHHSQTHQKVKHNQTSHEEANVHLRRNAIKPGWEANHWSKGPHKDDLIKYFHPELCSVDEWLCVTQDCYCDVVLKPDEIDLPDEMWDEQYRSCYDNSPDQEESGPQEDRPAIANK